MNSLVNLWNGVSKKMVNFATETYAVEHLISYNRYDNDVRVTWISCETKGDACLLREYLYQSGLDAYVSNTSVCAENCEIMEIAY